jgi:DeoR/GlpR family transcriptional regulator of sugar metabolism
MTNKYRGLYSPSCRTFLEDLAELKTAALSQSREKHLVASSSHMLGEEGVSQLFGL